MSTVTATATPSSPSDKKAKKDETRLKEMTEYAEYLKRMSERIQHFQITLMLQNSDDEVLRGGEGDNHSHQV